MFLRHTPVPQEAADINVSDLIEMHPHVHLGLAVCVAQSAAHFGNTVATGEYGHSSRRKDSDIAICVRMLYA